MIVVLSVDLLWSYIASMRVYTGVGALYVRRRPRVRLEPLQNGGGQERGLRSGTVPTPLAVGLGAACSIAQQEMEVYKHTWNTLSQFKCSHQLRSVCPPHVRTHTQLHTVQHTPTHCTTHTYTLLQHIIYIRIQPLCILLCEALNGFRKILTLCL